MYVGQDHRLSGVMKTQKDVPVPVLTKHYRLDKVISYECSLIAKMDSVHRRRVTEKMENGSFSLFSLPTVTDYRQMVEVLSGTADKLLLHQGKVFASTSCRTQDSRKS